MHYSVEYAARPLKGSMHGEARGIVTAPSVGVARKRIPRGSRIVSVTKVENVVDVMVNPNGRFWKGPERFDVHGVRKIRLYRVVA